MANNGMNPVGIPIGTTNNATFGTDGVRGHAGTVLTPSLVLELGYCTSQVLQSEGPILIGQDSRKSGDMLAAALTAGLTAAGKEVWKIGLCPTPTIPYLIKTLGAAGGLMVSASHNPPEDNGIKIFDSNGIKIDSGTQLLIEKNLTDELSKKKSTPSFSDFGKAYQRNDLLKSKGCKY